MKKLYLFALTAAMFGAVSCTPNGGDDSVPEYTVTFDADGGTPAPVAQKIKEGDKAAAPPAVSKTGYVFLYWSLNGTSAYDFSTPVTADITLTAHWKAADDPTVEYWAVTWELDGGAWPSGDDHDTQVVKGGTLAEPSAPTKSGFAFEGWYKESALTDKVSFPYDVSALTADFTLYAKWKSEGNNGDDEKTGCYIGDTHYPYFGEAFAAAQGTTAVITVYSNDLTSGRVLDENTHITIEGAGSGERTFEIGGGYDFFTIKTGASLTLKNVTLDAGGKSTNSLIKIEGGTFTMLEGAKVRGAMYNDGRGGGVFMSSGNFVMKGGSIEENKVPIVSHGIIRIAQGGGVLMTGGTFTMEGGEITKNTAEYVGGLYIYGGSFVMKGGRIHSNVATSADSDSNLSLRSPGTAVYGDGTPILEEGNSGTSEEITGK
jgi:uncharacterized repeat protein (TIGR02543 family)